MLTKKSTLCFIIFCFVLIQIGSISAFEFDNVKDIKETYGKAGYKDIEIKNAFGLGDELWYGSLDSNTEKCSRDCSATQTITLHKKGSLIDEVVFETLQEDGSWIEEPIINYKIYIKTGQTSKLVDEHKIECSKTGKFSKNGTAINECLQVVARSYIKYTDVWEEYILGTELEAGVYEVKLEGVKKPDKSIEWIYKTQGVTLNEWAVWIGNPVFNDVIAYWNCDNNSGNLIDNSRGLVNMTNIFTPVSVPGIINNATQGNGTVGWEIGGLSVPDYFNLTETNWTINFWFNKTSAGDDNIMWANFPLFTIYTTGGKIRVYFELLDTTSTFAPNLNQSYMLTLTSDTTNTSKKKLYVNGVYNESLTNAGTWDLQAYLEKAYASGGNFAMLQVATGAGTVGFRGWMDEVGIWNESLTSAQITEVYNSHDGLPYEGSYLDFSIALNSPADDYSTINKTVMFNCTATVGGGFNITNISLYHNGTGTWALDQTNSTLRLSNSTSIFYVDFPNYGSFKWNCYACMDDDTCIYGDNRTINLLTFIINNQTYNKNTIEGSSEDFILNLTVVPELIITESQFIYNGNYSSAQRFLVEGDYIIRKIGLIVPNVEAETNKSFNWILNLSDSSAIITDKINQTVSNISINTCATLTNNIINFTLVDEEAQTLLTDNITIETAFNLFSTDRSILIANYSNNFSSNIVSICLNRELLSNTNYSLDAIVRYEAQDHANEYFNMHNFSLTNLTEFQNITLFDLLSSDSTEFQLTFTGSDFVTVENALVFVMRQYISENVFKTVELPKTDSNGQTLIHLVRNDIVYNIEVTKGGVVLGSFNNIIAFCEDVSIGNCKINLNAFSTGEPIFDYDESLGITFTGPTFDNSTRVMSFNYLTTDGSTKTVTMEVTRNDIFGNRTLCNSTIESSGGSLVCTVPDIDDTLIITKVFVEGEEVVKDYTFLDSINFGKAGYFIFFVFMLSFILMFNKSKTTTLIGIFVGFLAGISLGLIEGAVVGIGASGIWLIIVLVLMLWKLNKERSN